MTPKRERSHLSRWHGNGKGAIPWNRQANKQNWVENGRSGTRNMRRHSMEELGSSTYVIRPFGRQDVGVVTDLIDSAMNADEARWADSTLRFHLECRSARIDDSREYHLMTCRGKVVGFCGLHNYVWGPREVVWLGWFAVAPSHQRQGVGARLLEHVIARGRELGYRELYIEAYDSPVFDKAHRFYGKHGFRKVGGIAGYLPGGSSMIVYSLGLGPGFREP